MATANTTKTTKRVRKAVPAPAPVKRDADGNVVIPADIRRKMSKVIDLLEEEARIKAELEAMKADVLMFVDSSDEKTIEYLNAKFTRVAGTKTVMDEEELKNKLGTSKFNTISVRKVDKKLLDGAIQKGTVSAKDVADVTTVSQNKPYLKVTKS